MYDLLAITARIGQIADAIEQVSKTQGIFPQDHSELYVRVLGIPNGNLEQLGKALKSSVQQYRQLVDMRYAFLNPVDKGDEQFTVYWLGGKVQIITGKTFEDAMTKNGYGQGSLAAVDFYDNGSNVRYLYSTVAKKWYPKHQALPEDYIRQVKPIPTLRNIGYMLSVSANLDQLQKLVIKYDQVLYWKGSEFLSMFHPKPDSDVPNRVYAHFLPEDYEKAFGLYEFLRGENLIAARNWLPE